MTAIVRANALAIPLRDASVDLIVTSPPYFNQRSYRDGGEHYDGQIGSEPHPREFLEALWAVTRECWRVLKPSGTMFVNLGDKRSGSGAPGTTSGLGGQAQGERTGFSEKSTLRGNGHRAGGPKQTRTLRPQYVKAAFGRAKSKQLLPQRFAIGCEDGLADPDGIGWIVRQELIWDKLNGLPESALDRCRDSHEAWWHLTKRGNYFAAIDAIRTRPTSRADQLTWEERKAKGEPGRQGEQTAFASACSLRPNPLGALPRSVWSIATEPFTAPDHLGVDHFAAFPSEWPRRLILGWCPTDGIVLDPFGGTGTTAMVARALGRTGISLDLSRDYNRLAAWRIFESDGAAKVADRTAGERQGALL